MTDRELFDAIDGLFAYDTGCVSSGIRDEALRDQVKRELHLDAESRPHSLAGPRLTKFAARFVAPPFSLEDMAIFIRWLDGKMGITL